MRAAAGLLTAFLALQAAGHQGKAGAQEKVEAVLFAAKGLRFPSRTAPPTTCRGTW